MRLNAVKESKLNLREKRQQQKKRDKKRESKSYGCFALFIGGGHFETVERRIASFGFSVLFYR